MKKNSSSIKIFSTAPKLLSVTSVVSMLFACGGGGNANVDGLVTPAIAPSGIIMSGTVVVNQAVSNAVVCVDIDLSGICESTEPKSNATGTDGRYIINYQPANPADWAALQVAPFLAAIPAGLIASGAAVDAAAPTVALTVKAYVLAAPAGKTVQINPLTTMVQIGIKSGMALPDAEAAVALQLGITKTASLYDYQSDPADANRFLDNSRGVAQIVADGLASGLTLTVRAPDTDIVAATQLAALTYSDASNYSLRMLTTTAQKALNGYSTQVDGRTGQALGVPIAHDALYVRAGLSATGWVRCDETLLNINSVGGPGRSLGCSGSQNSLSLNIAEDDVSGQKMADVFTTLQAATDGSSVTTVPPAAFGNAVFPVGSVVRTRRGIDLVQNPIINNISTDSITIGGVAVATLEKLVQLRSAAAVSGINGSLGLGLIDSTHSLRVAFIDASTAQFYSCNSTPPLNLDISNCVPVSTGPYVISTVPGTRLLSFPNFPATTNTTSRGFTEFAGMVYSFRLNKTDRSVATTLAKRFTTIAANAIKTTLGIQ